MNRKQRRMAAKQGKQKTLSLDEALPLAVKLHQGGHLDQAENLYQQILQIVPDHPDALHFLGILRYQHGQGQEAIELIGRSIALNPNHPDAHNNLGNVFKNQGRLQEAAACYRTTIALNPDHADAHNNLGIMLKEQGKTEEAVAAYRKAIDLQPNHADAYHNLGNILTESGRFSEAIPAYYKAIALNPNHFEAYKNLGITLHKSGNAQEAAKVFQRWLDIDPDNPVALHMLAACSGQNIPTRASDRYVQQLFDRFAATFDQHLQRLDYRAPWLIAEALKSQPTILQKPLDILDAGCGTGLCGPLLRPYARRLVGVDLSPGMLIKARERGIYDELITAELTAFLAARQEVYDVIVSADTLVYFGDLQPVMAAAARALRKPGWLAFTVESTEDETAGRGFYLNPHGRYSHTEDYLKRIVAAAGLQICTLTPATLRLEDTRPVLGKVFLVNRM